MKAQKPELVPVAIDNTGEPYICQRPVVYVGTPKAEPQWMTRVEYERLRADWSRGKLATEGTGDG